MRSFFDTLWAILGQIWHNRRAIFGLRFRQGPAMTVVSLWKLFAYLVFFAWFSVQAIEWNFLGLFGRSPSIASLERPKLQIASDVYSADGVLLGKYFKQNRVPVEYHQISPNVIKALLATEDIRFTQHSGIDPTAIVSIVFYLAKGDNRGGSTLTQQLAKNLYQIRGNASKGLLGYIPGISTVVAKSKEWITAVKLERAYTKEEILTMYLNTVDFGNNSYGIKIAAQNYFGKEPATLDVEEAAMLVGLLKGTTLYNPRRHPKRALTRRNTVLAQMQKYGFLTEAQYEALAQKPIELRTLEQTPSDGVPDYYGQYLTQVLEQWMEDSRQESDADDLEHPEGYNIYTDGLKIYLTINSKVQAHAKAAVSEHMKVVQQRFDEHWRGQNPWRDEKGKEIPNFLTNAIKRTEAFKELKARYKGDTAQIFPVLRQPKPMRVFSWKNEGGEEKVFSSFDSLAYYKRFLRAGLMAMEPQNGHIKAWVGGVNYDYFKYDAVKQSKRQPGSTFKAFVYATAIDQGYSPCYKLPDEWRRYQFRDTVKGKPIDTTWVPRNANGYFSGQMMTLRYAMGRSINSIAAQLTDLMTPQKVADYARRMGVTSQLKPKPALGLGSSDISLYEMVGAYATFVNEGFWTQPIIVARIEDHKGNLVKQFRPKRQKALSVEAAYTMVHMLKGTLQEPGGTAQALFSYHIFRGNDLGGKTGTSSNQSDGWFMGITPTLVGGVWVGAEDRSIHFRTMRLGEGSKVALPIWGKFLEKVYADPSTGIGPSQFPKTLQKIAQRYYCPTYVAPKIDSTALDSLSGDDSGLDMPVEEPGENDL